MNALPTTKQEKLAALRRRLAEQLPALVADLETACTEFLDVPSDAARHERAVRTSHSMAGTAGTYGFLELGRTARSLELLLRPMAGGAGLQEADARDLLARIRSESETARLSVSPA